MPAATSVLHDAVAQQEQCYGRGGEDGVLPGFAESASERDGRSEDRADRRGAGAIEERPHARVPAQAIEAIGAEQDERERGGEGDRRGEQPSADARGGVADDGDGRGPPAPA